MGESKDKLKHSCSPEKREGSLSVGVDTNVTRGENPGGEPDSMHPALDNSGLSFSLDFDMILLKPAILLFTLNVVSCASK